MKLSSKQFWLNCIVHRLFLRKVLRELDTVQALPLYPLFEDQNSGWPDEKSVKRKIASPKA